MLSDLRYGLRQLIKHPGFTFIAVLTLALGIGANTAIFSVVNALLLKPLPFPQPEQLLALGMTDTRQKDRTDLGSLSYADYFDFRDQNRTLQNIAVYRDTGMAVGGAEGATNVRGVKVSADYFDVLGIKPQIGRGFAREDEQSGGGPGGFKVIISYDYWKKQFGGTQDVIGKTIELERRPHTVIGVMPRGFQFPISSDPMEVYVTIAADSTLR